MNSNEYKYKNNAMLHVCLPNEQYTNTIFVCDEATNIDRKC